MVLAAAAAGVAAGTAYEGPASFQASKILPAAVVKGPHYSVAEAVKAEGYYQQFQITSDFGPLGAEGRTMLKTRIHEVGALAELSEVSKGEEFAKAAGGAVLKVGGSVAHAVTDPEATVKGIGGGVKRFGVNLGRKAKRGAESATSDDKKPEDTSKSSEDKAIDAAGGAANSVFGVNGAARKWAQKLGVDPYSTNPVLHKALVDMGKIDAAGSIAVKVVVPIPMVVSTTASVSNLVWAADPEAVRKENEKRLGELAVTPAVQKRFFTNGNYTLTSQVRFIAALHAVKAKGVADYVDAASEAESEREALFFVESAELLSGLHKVEPVAAVLEDSRGLVAKTGARAVVLLPVDWLRWTEQIHKAATDLAARAKRELGATSLEVRVSGGASPAAKAGLQAAGWTVKEGESAGLSVPPAD
jgi:hypothetical protein